MRERSRGPSLPRVMLSRGSTGITTASESRPIRHPLPGSSPVNRRRSSTGTVIRFGRGEPPQFPPTPSEPSAHSTPDSPSRLHLQDLRRFHGLRHDSRGSALSYPLTTRQASLRLADRSVAPTIVASTLGFDPTRFQTEPPACYRASWQLWGFTGWQRASHQVMISGPITSDQLGARNFGLTRTYTTDVGRRSHDASFTDN